MGFMGVRSEKKCCTVVVVISHIQHIGCQPGKSASSDGQSRSWSTENREERKKKKKSGSAIPNAARSNETK